MVLQLVLALASLSALNTTLLILMVLLIPVELVLFIIAFLLSMIGAVRYSRTGSVREGIRLGQVLAHIRAIGWSTMILTAIFLFVAGLCLNIAIGIFSFIPYSGMALSPLLQPFLTVLSARFISQVYDSAAAPGSHDSVELKKEAGSIMRILLIAGVVLLILAAVMIAAALAALSTGAIGASTQKIVVVAVTAQQQGDQVIVTYRGGRDASQVVSLDIRVNDQNRTVSSPSVDDQWIFTGTSGRDHVVIYALLTSEARQTILDTYV